MDLQTKYDLEMAALELKDRLEVEVRPCPQTGNARSKHPEMKQQRVRSPPSQGAA
jgi:hypothetical protein